MAARIWLLAAALLLPGCSARAADLITPAPQAEIASMTVEEQALVDRLKKQATTRSLSVIRLDLGSLKRSDLTLGLRSDRRVKVSSTSVDRRSDTDFTWYGTLAEAAGSATLVVRGDRVTGTIRSGKELYRIRPIGSGLHALIEIDQSKFPQDHPPTFKEKELQRYEFSPRDRLQADAQTVTVEVLVAYTPSAESADGNIAGTIQLAIDETNQSYKNSGINARVHLAHTHKVKFREQGSSFNMILARFASTGDGPMDEIDGLRSLHAADVAVLLINQTAFCGLARTIRAAAGSGFAIVHYDCATGNYSFGHEIGHLQGARHNPEVDSATTPFAYGHGYQYGSSWRTIMAYDCSPSCPRLQYWSNPNVSYGGVAMGTTATHNNARVLNETASTVGSFRPTSGAVWRFTGTACSGNSCPGWQRLDNNSKTIGIVAAGDALYQLHHDGWIWRYTGTPCSGNSCPGWQRLDNNANTVTIAAAGATLYQLHNDGGIWRYTGTPCSGNSCPGWQRLDNNSDTVAITAAGSALYQLHGDGGIWRHTGTPCSGTSCPGWQKLDNNAKSIAIAAGGTALYQLHNDGMIWRYTGTPCSGSSCPGWQRLDNNTKTVAIASAGTALYQLHNDGMIWRYTGTPCSGNSCPGWQRLDNNLKTVGIVAADNALYQLHDDGMIWRYTGTPCSGNSCPGWLRLDNNSKTERLTAGSQLYQLH